MKIAHVVDSMEMGGAETLVSQLCDLQREQGHAPCVLALASLGELGVRLRKDGFTVHAEVGRHFFPAAPNFMRLFKELRPDVVHLHNPTPTIYAAIPARLAGASCIVSTRHSLVAPPHSFVQEFKYAIAALFCDWVAGVCDATTTNLRRLRSVRGGKLVRVYNGAAPLTRTANEHCPPKTGLTLLFVGRLEPVKDLGLLLHAVRIALSSRPDLRLWVVGDGTERNRLEALAAELGIAAQVKFWGRVADVAPFYSAADLFVMSSKSEGLPISLVQGFSLALPAIVTDAGGMAEAVRLAHAGIVVPPADSGELAAAILRLAAEPAERKRLSENAREAFDAHFDLPALAAAYFRLYRSTRRIGVSETI